MLIRVDPVILKQNSGSIFGIGSSVNNSGQSASSSAQGAPSYDGQFGPRVQAIGHEALARAQGLLNQMNNLSSQLQSKAQAFEAADMAGVAGFANINNGAQIPATGPWWTGLPVDIINLILKLGGLFGGAAFTGLLGTVLLGNNLFSGNGQISGSPATKPSTTIGNINPVQGVKPVLTQGIHNSGNGQTSGSPITKPSTTFGDLIKKVEGDEVPKFIPSFHQINQFEAMYAQYKMTSNTDCGPASLVMVLSSLGLCIPGTNDKSSDGELIFFARKLMVTDKARDGINDQGKIEIAEHKKFVTLDEIIYGANATGAKAESITPNAKSIQKALEGGEKVIVSGTFAGKDPLPWTGDRGHDNNTAPGGATKHLIAVTGYDPKSKLFTINDPARKEPMQVTGEKLADFMEKNAGAVAIGK